MNEWVLCPRCLTVTELNDDILIFDNKQDSELIYSGTCGLCNKSVYKHYPLTKDTLQTK